ncbi:dynein light chain Tctex-type protein 2B-like [Oratosquilla oratoria]|uniref:dynein light chain Tctex-type protein 2B-like n=1 Tax=Oratosquilla oratoria TaxID=337810 RepID=UPI003F7615A6
METASRASDQTFHIRPNPDDKFRSSTVRDVIHQVLVSNLSNYIYTTETADSTASNLSEAIRNKVVELSLPRYKYIVNVVMGANRGEGVKVGARCLWDADSDNFASDVFITETFFCTASVFAIYYY